MDVREAWASRRCLATWSAKEDRDAAPSSSPLAVPASSSLLLVLSFPSTNSSSVSASTQCATSQHQLPKVKNTNPSPSPCLFLSTLTHPHPCFPLNMVSSQPDVPYVAPGSKAHTISADLGGKKKGYKTEDAQGRPGICKGKWKSSGETGSFGGLSVCEKKKNPVTVAKACHLEISLKDLYRLRKSALDS